MAALFTSFVLGALLGAAFAVVVMFTIAAIFGEGPVGRR